MENQKNVIFDLWEYLDRPNLNKTEQKIYNWLNHDNLTSIIVDDNIFYFEKTCSYTTMPDYIFDWLKKWTSKKYKLTYLYDLKNNY
jgi:hypothetical protein